MESSRDLDELRAELDLMRNQAEAFVERLDAFEERIDARSEPVKTKEAPSITPPPLPPGPRLSEPAEVATRPITKPSPPAAGKTSEPEVLRDDSVTGPAGVTRDDAVSLEETPQAKVDPAPKTPASIVKPSPAKPPKKDVNWEMAIGTYWLPRVGMGVMAIGLVFFLTLAIQKLSNHPLAPYARVGLGYLACGVLLALGYRLERKYRSYGRLLFAGGVGLSYFVTFAAHFIEPARIIQSAPLAITILALVVTVWAFFAQVRKSRSMALTVSVLGHFTILWSSLYVGEVSQFLPLGIVLLGVGSAFFLLRNGWYYVAAAGLVGSYVNHFVWMFQWDAPLQWSLDFNIAMGVISVYLLTFALAELFAPDKLRRAGIPTWFRTTFVTINTASFFTLATIIMTNFEVTRANHHIFHFSYAIALMLIALAYLHLRRHDPLFNVYMTKAVAVATLGLAMYFQGNGLTAWLAVETVVLLVASRRSGLAVTRVLAFAVGALALGNGAYNILEQPTLAYGAEGYQAALIQATLTVAAFFLSSLIYQKTNWADRSPRTLPLPKDTLFNLWQFDLVADKPSGYEHTRKPLGGLLFPYLYAFAAMILFCGFTTELVGQGDFTPVYAGFALITLAAAFFLRSLPLAFTSIAAAPFVLFWGTREIIMDETLSVAMALPCIAVLACVALASERIVWGEREALRFHRAKLSPYMLYGTVAWLTALLVIRELGGAQMVLAFMALSVLYGALARVLHARPLAWMAVAMILCANLYCIARMRTTLPWSIHTTTWGLAALTLLGDRYLHHMTKRTRLPWLGAIPVAAACCLLHGYLADRFGVQWDLIVHSAVTFGFLAYGLAFRSKMAVAVAVLGNVVASVAIFSVRLSGAWSSVLVVIAGSLAVIAFWVLCERLYARWGEGHKLWNKWDPIGLLVAASTGLLVTLLYRIPALADYYLTISWTLAALVLFGASLCFKQKFYRYAGLSVFALAVGRVLLVDTRELEALPRIAAFLVLGMVLLGVGFGYLKAVERLGASRDDAAR